MEIDRRAFIASLGGTATVGLMDSEAKADALEHWMEDQWTSRPRQGTRRRPTVAELEAQIETRNYRRAPQCIRNTRGTSRTPADAEESNLRLLPAAVRPANHVLQTPRRPQDRMRRNHLACLSTTAQALMKADHSVGAQLRAYIRRSRRSVSAITRLCASTPMPTRLRIPGSLLRISARTVPPPHIEATYKMLRNHNGTWSRVS